MTYNESKDIEIHKERLMQLIDDFREKILTGTSNPSNFFTISDIERLWSELRGNTGVLYSDLLEDILKEINESELISKKKRIPEKRHRFTDKQKVSTVYINNQWEACFLTL